VSNAERFAEDIREARYFHPGTGASNKELARRLERAAASLKARRGWYAAHCLALRWASWAAGRPRVK
jgi:hypothetical protein